MPVCSIPPAAATEAADEPVSKAVAAEHWATAAEHLCVTTTGTCWLTSVNIVNLSLAQQ